MKKEEKIVMLAMRLPLSMRDKFVAIVNKNGQKQNFVLNKLIENYIKENENKKEVL